MKNWSKILLIAGLVVAGLAGCQKHNFSMKAAKNALNLSARDTTVDPADNFYLYANGTWLKNTEIPPSKSSWGSFNIVHVKVQHRLHTILDSVSSINDAKKGSIVQQTGDLYQSAMDTVTIEKRGINPLKDELKRIASIQTPKDVINEVVLEYKHGNGTMFSFRVAPATKHSSIEHVHLNQGGLGLRNPVYYTKENKRFKKVLHAYHTYIAKLLNLSGASKSEANEAADQIIALETELAKASKPPVKLRNPYKNYHLMSVQTLHSQTPNINWQRIFSRMKVNVDTVEVGQPKFYKKLSSLLESTPVSVWKKYLKFHLISGYAPWLSTPYQMASFNFRQVLTGQKKREKRWKRATTLVSRTIGEALGQLYVERYFPPEYKQYMENMVENLQDAYREKLKHESWMSEATQKKAVEKLNAIIKKIGYPDEWKDYSSIDIDNTHLIANLQHIGQWHYQYMIDKLGEPTNKDEWFMTPQTVNAYYNPSFNEIVFPAGILLPPFYHPGADPAVNYGAIGAVIGHEMTHGFDDQGSKFDKMVI